MVTITFAGLNELKGEFPNLKEYIKKISQHYVEKIEQSLKIENLKVRVKEYSKKGKAHKYSVHVHLRAGKNKLTAEAADWDISRVMHKVFKDVERQVIHVFKTDTGYKKKYY